MIKYTRKFFFAKGLYTKLTFVSQNAGLTKANLDFKFKKLETKFKEENPYYFSETYQKTAKKKHEDLLIKLYGKLESRKFQI